MFIPYIKSVHIFLVFRAICASIKVMKYVSKVLNGYVGPVIKDRWAYVCLHFFFLLFVAVVCFMLFRQCLRLQSFLPSRSLYNTGLLCSQRTLNSPVSQVLEHRCGCSSFPLHDSCSLSALLYLHASAAYSQDCHM